MSNAKAVPVADRTSEKILGIAATIIIILVSAIGTMFLMNQEKNYLALMETNKNIKMTNEALGLINVTLSAYQGVHILQSKGISDNADNIKAIASRVYSLEGKIK